MKNLQSSLKFGCLVMLTFLVGLGIGYFGMLHRIDGQRASKPHQPVSKVNEMVPPPVTTTANDKNMAATSTVVMAKVTDKSELKPNKDRVAMASKKMAVVTQKNKNLEKNTIANKKLATTKTLITQKKPEPQKIPVTPLEKVRPAKDGAVALPQKTQQPKEVLARAESAKNQKSVKLSPEEVQAQQADKAKSILRGMIATIAPADDDDLLNDVTLPGGKSSKKAPIKVALYPDQIRRKISSNQSAFRVCYERDMSGKAGKVVVKFTIGADGKIADHSIRESSLNSEVAECIVRNLQTISFPQPSEGKFTFNYPFIFTSAE
jgi:TonB family protein